MSRPRKAAGTMPQRAPKKPRNRQVTEGLTLTPAIQEKICGALRAGATLETAFAFAGVGSSTARVWLRNGRNNVAPVYVQLVEAVDLAVADGKMRDIVRIDKGADDDWRAAAWKLERRFPGEYGQTTKNETSLTVQARPFIDTSKLSLDEQQQLLELLRKGSPDPEALPKDGQSALALMPGDPVNA